MFVAEVVDLGRRVSASFCTLFPSGTTEVDDLGYTGAPEFAPVTDSQALAERATRRRRRGDVAVSPVPAVTPSAKPVATSPPIPTSGTVPSTP